MAHDWTSVTSNPLDPIVREKISLYLNNIRSKIPNNNYTEYLISEVSNKSVLDIGVCEHTIERMDSNDWKHNIIRKYSKEILGIDIIEDLVGLLQDKGFNVITCDATSDIYLGKTFDVIHVGDVIEHVESPIKLLKFCKRHLSRNGKIILRTPNCHCFDYINLQKKHGTDKSNLEHMYYISPTHALEIARRANVKLSKYLTLYPGGFSMSGVYNFIYFALHRRLRHAFAEFLCGPEQFSTFFVFEFIESELV